MERKRTDLEIKFDNFLSNHWLHQVREISELRGRVSILIGLVSGLFAFVLGTWAVEVLR